MIAEVGRWVLAEPVVRAPDGTTAGYPLDVSVNVSARQLENDKSDRGRPCRPGHLRIRSHVTDHRNHRNGHHEERGRRRPSAGRPQSHRGPHRHRRLRYRLLLAWPISSNSPSTPSRSTASFISSMADSPESGALIRTLVQLGKTLGLETLAEGIEETEQYSQLRREHCDSGQGFLYARPLDVDAVESFIWPAASRTATGGAGRGADPLIAAILQPPVNPSDPWPDGSIRHRRRLRCADERRTWRPVASRRCSRRQDGLGNVTWTGRASTRQPSAAISEIPAAGRTPLRHKSLTSPSESRLPHTQRVTLSARRTVSL